jgi:hypothetical protein
VPIEDGRPDLGEIVAEVKYTRFHVVWRIVGALLACFAAFVVLVSRGLAHVDEPEGAWGALKIAAVALAIVALSVIPLAAYHRRDRLVVRARGVEQRMGSRRVAFAFENVIASRTWHDRRCKPESIDVRLLDGSTCKLVTPPGGAATEALVAALDDHHRARAREAFDAARSIRYGDVEVHPTRGVIRDAHVLAWSSLSEVSITPELVVVSERTRDGGKKDWTVIMPDGNDAIDGLVAAIALGRARADARQA